MDAKLANIYNNGSRITFCSAQPSAWGDIASMALLSAALTTGSATVSFQITAGSSGSARALNVKAITGMAPIKAGTATNVVIDNNANTLLAITTMTSQVLATGQTWNSPAFNIQENDPV
jgi:hypothetical protein